MLSSLLLLSLAALPPAGNEIEGKVVCGYQGWFRAEGDGTGLGWHHYTEGRRFAPGSCSIDLWPDVRELPEADRFDTPFRHPDGSVAQVFSSTRPSTVRVHFEWMRDYGIDGVFLQRFATTTRDPRHRAAMDSILAAVRSSADETGRLWAVMYDLSGLRPGQTGSLIEDWKRLEADHGMAEALRAPSYLRHEGRPIVALWGLGFNDRAPMLDEWRELVRFFREAGCSVLLGVPAYWRTLDRDTIADPALHEILATADILLPWTVGRYNSPAGAARYASETLAGDLAWGREKGPELLPVAFPGFSWRNLMARRGKDERLNAIPRLGGDFLWSQCRADVSAGARMLYIAMFDELDEGTAIFKVRQDAPTGASQFVSEPDVPGDRYLRVAGEAGRLLRGEIGPVEKPRW
jgi:hypothetical protein